MNTDHFKRRRKEAESIRRVLTVWLARTLGANFCLNQSRRADVCFVCTTTNRVFRRAEENVVISIKRLLPVVSFLVPFVLAGCNVEKHQHGDGEDVRVGTPFGSVNVKTDADTAMAGIGLTPYPGATLVHKNGHDDGAADVNLSFGTWKLGVHAADMRSGDPQDKVLAFYRKDMAKYGAVLTCRGHEPVGQPTRTADGLTCSTDQHGNDDSELQLRAGSPQHQHIVGVRSDDGQTRIGLVALELPAGLNHHDDGDRE